MSDSIERPFQGLWKLDDFYLINFAVNLPTLFWVRCPMSPQPPYGSFFGIFAERLGTLQRHFELARRYFSSYLQEATQEYSELSRTDRQESSFGDMLFSDRHYISQNLYGSVQVHAVSLLETLLLGVSGQVASFKRLTLPRPVRGKSYIQYRIDFLRDDCGWPLQLDAATANELNHIRLLPNAFVHELGGELGAAKMVVHQEGARSAKNRVLVIDDVMVRDALGVVGRVATVIQDVFWEDYKDNRAIYEPEDFVDALDDWEELEGS